MLLALTTACDAQSQIRCPAPAGEFFSLSDLDNVSQTDSRLSAASDSYSLVRMMRIGNDSSAEATTPTRELPQDDARSKTAAVPGLTTFGSSPTPSPELWCADLCAECIDGGTAGDVSADSGWWVESFEGLRESWDKTVDGFECCPRPRPHAGHASSGWAFSQSF